MRIKSELLSFCLFTHCRFQRSLFCSHCGRKSQRFFATKEFYRSGLIFSTRFSKHPLLHHKIVFIFTFVCVSQPVHYFHAKSGEPVVLHAKYHCYLAFALWFERVITYDCGKNIQRAKDDSVFRSLKVIRCCNTF